MSEPNTVTESRPKKIWDGALRMVKGENTSQLVEQFTAEMTLVAEGLCEDQNTLHQKVDKMMAEEDRRIQKLQSQVDLLETTLDEERTAHDREMAELRNRLSSVEKSVSRDCTEKRAGKDKKGNIIHDLTVLVGIAAGAWVIVTILNLLH